MPDLGKATVDTVEANEWLLAVVMEGDVPTLRRVERRKAVRGLWDNTSGVEVLVVSDIDAVLTVSEFRGSNAAGLLFAAAGTGLVLGAASGTYGKLAFFGATAVTKPVGAAQAALAANTAVVAAGATPTKAEFDAVVADLAAARALLAQLRADLVTLGLIKGSA